MTGDVSFPQVVALLLADVAACRRGRRSGSMGANVVLPAHFGRLGPGKSRGVVGIG